MGDNRSMKVEEPDNDNIAASTLILAAAALLGREHILSSELLYIARALVHPMIVVKEPRMESQTSTAR